MTESPSEDVLGRIRKLLALAHGQGATEAEAASAMAKANELLLRYNLSADSVASQHGDSRAAKVEEDSMRLGRRENWQHRLLVALARNNWCYPFFAEDRVIFVGRSTNVAVTREMFNWIAPQLERLADQEWAAFSSGGGNVLTLDNSWCTECEEGSYREPGRRCSDCDTVLISPRIHGRTWKANFYRGITWRISQRLYEERKELENDSGPSKGAPAAATAITALAVRNLTLATRHENEAFIERRHGKLLNKRSSGGRYDGSAYNRGTSAGARVSLRGHRLGGGARAELPPAR